MENEFVLNSKNYEIFVKSYLPKSKPKEIILACHGFGGDKESSIIKILAEHFVPQNYAFFCFDFPAHGKSQVDGDFLNIENCVSDIETVMKFIKSKYLGVPVSIFSTSFGAYVTLIKLKKGNNDTNDFRKIILRAPAICMAKIFKENLLKIDFEKFKTDGFAVMGYERTMKIPYSFYEELQNNNIFEIYKNDHDIKLDIIQGNADDIAPFEDTLEFQKNRKNVSVFVIQGANHRMKRPEDIENVIKYVEKILKN